MIDGGQGGGGRKKIESSEKCSSGAGDGKDGDKGIV